MATPTQVFGVPASYSRALGRRAFAAETGLALVVVGALLLALSTPSARVVGVAIALAAGVGARHVHGRRARLRAGTRSEERVARALAGLGYTVLLNGYHLGAGGDCDHVVAGPILAAVETKSGRGRVERRGTTITHGGRPFPRDPVTQARRQATALHRLAGTRASAIVCVVDMANAPVHVDDVTVCSLDDLPRVLATCPPACPPEHAVRLAEDLRRAARGAS